MTLIPPYTHDFTQIIIDGNDGTGKTTLADRLRKLGHRVLDRGVVTYAVDHGLPADRRRPNDIHVVLTTTPEICRERLVLAGRADEPYHDLAALTQYMPRYVAVAEQIGAHIIDSSGDQDVTECLTREAIGDVLPPNWPFLSPEQFDALPIVRKGESKDVRDVGAGRSLIRLLPTLYSFTHNRSGVVPGTDELRVRAAKVMTAWLAGAGIPHAYLDFNGPYILASNVTNPPPIETIVKGFHVGTSYHRYFGMAERGVAYPSPIVRFDWRNPMHHPESGARLADEPLCDDMAAWWYDVPAAKKVALATWDVLCSQLRARGMVLVDGCYLLTSGGAHYGEITPDSMRVTKAGEHLDKQLWRGGSEPEELLRAWGRFCDLIER